MRDIHVSAITDTIKKLCMEANWNLGPEMLRAFDKALTTERSAAGKQVLQILKQNAEIARTKRVAYCQDTGVTVCFVELGQDVHVTGGGLYDAINEGVRQGYTEGFLRASMVKSPFDRVNTGDNTPAVIHVDVVPGAELKLAIMAKGGGCENRSKYTMLTPAAGLEGVKDFIIECVKMAGPDACPPLILGVGVGGTFEKAALLSKKALFREIGSPNPDPFLDALEQELLERANRLGIGPQGYGGDTTAFGIHVHLVPVPHHVAARCRDDRDATRIATRRPRCEYAYRSRQDRLDGNRRSARAGHLLAAADHPEVHRGHRHHHRNGGHLPGRENSRQLPGGPDRGPARAGLADAAGRAGQAARGQHRQAAEHQRVGPAAQGRDQGAAGAGLPGARLPRESDDRRGAGDQDALREGAGERREPGAAGRELRPAGRRPR